MLRTLYTWFSKSAQRSRIYSEIKQLFVENIDCVSTRFLMGLCNRNPSTRYFYVYMYIHTTKKIDKVMADIPGWLGQGEVFVYIYIDQAGGPFKPPLSI